MPNKFIPFPKIQQYKATIKQLTEAIQYTGMMDMGGSIGEQPQFDKSIPLPKLRFKGTVKLHGTNAAICFSEDAIWFQSRKRIITVGNDNAGFAAWAETIRSKIEAFRETSIQPGEVYAIFGEWCGGNIQRKVALQELAKHFVVFETALVIDGGTPFFMGDRETARAAEAIGCNDVVSTQAFFETIDLNFPNLTLPLLQDITLGVEDTCPYAFQQGVTGIGEGVVWKCDYAGKRYRFKVKGDKHTGGGVKKLQAANTPQEELAIANFVNDHACTVSRLEQGYQEVFDTLNNGVYDVKKTGEFIRWMVNDVHAEESENLGNLTPKQVNGYIARAAKQWLHAGGAAE